MGKKIKIWFVLRTLILVLFTFHFTKRLYNFSTAKKDTENWFAENLSIWGQIPEQKVLIYPIAYEDFANEPPHKRIIKVMAVKNEQTLDYICYAYTADEQILELGEAREELIAFAKWSLYDGYFINCPCDHVTYPNYLSGISVIVKTYGGIIPKRPMARIKHIHVEAYKHNFTVCISAIYNTPLKPPHLPYYNNSFYVNQLDLFLRYYHSHGVDKFVFYYQNASAAIQRALREIRIRHKNFTATVEVILWPNPFPPFKFANGSSFFFEDYFHRRGQKLSIHDCTLRETNRSMWLGIIDVDEIIYPRGGNNLLEFLKSKDQSTYGSFLFHTTFVHAGWMQKSTEASVNWRKEIGQITGDSYIFPPPERSKAVFKPNKIYSQHVHCVAEYRNSRYKTVIVNLTDALIYHMKPFDHHEKFHGDSIAVDQSFKNYLIALFEQ